MQTVITFILVHGALMGSWSWNKTVSHIQSLGHNPIVLDLPGRAGDQTDPKKIDLHMAAQKVVDVMKLQSGKVVLVGHSQGGMVISQAAEMYPEKVQSLIYVAAVLPRHGQNLADVLRDDTESHIEENLIIESEKGTMRFDPSSDFQGIIAQDVPLREIRRVERNMVPEPLGIGSTPVSLTDDRFGRIHKSYILTTRDRVLSPGIQKKMARDAHVNRLIRLRTSHMPLISEPRGLADILVMLGKSTLNDSTTTIRDFFAAIANRNIDKARELMDKDVLWYQPGTSRIAGLYKGREAVLGFFDAVKELSDNTFSVVVESIFERNGIVLVSVRYSATRGGHTMTGKGINLYRVEDGKIIEATLFSDDEELEEDFWGS